MIEVALPPLRINVMNTEDLRTAVTRLAADFVRVELATPLLDARLLVAYVCNLTYEDYVMNPDRALSACEAEMVETMRLRRMNGEPVSRIIGKREFWGLEFLIGGAVLDPRPDTETLVEAALDVLGEEGLRDAPLRVADLGTGSGCILLSILSELPEAKGIGVDISTDALIIAKKNAARLGLETRITFIAGNWCDDLPDGMDMIVTNPPYIETEVIGNLESEVRSYDPLQALDGGDDGLDAYREISENSLQKLRPGGWILLEAGAGQAEAIISIFNNSVWGNEIAFLRVISDLNGINRVVAIKRHD